jgi:hypothetical protein
VRGRRWGRLGQKGEGKRWAAAGPVGGGREVGCGWAENQKWSDSRKKSFRILFGVWIFGKFWKFAQGDFEGILTWGFFLKSSRLLKDFLENEICHAMLCNLRSKFNLEKIFPHTIYFKKCNLMHF